MYKFKFNYASIVVALTNSPLSFFFFNNTKAVVLNESFFDILNYKDTTGCYLLKPVCMYVSSQPYMSHAKPFHCPWITKHNFDIKKYCKPPSRKHLLVMRSVWRSALICQFCLLHNYYSVTSLFTLTSKGSILGEVTTSGFLFVTLIWFLIHKERHSSLPHGLYNFQVRNNFYILCGIRVYKLLPHFSKIYLLIISLNKWTWQCCPIKYTTLSYKKQHTVLQWPLKMNTAPTTAQANDLKGHMWTLQWKQKCMNQGWYLRRKLRNVLYFSIPQHYSKF